MYVLVVVHKQNTMVSYPLQNISYFMCEEGEEGRVNTERNKTSFCPLSVKSVT